MRLLSIVIALGAAVAGLTSIGASPAAAAECRKLNTAWVFCVGNEPIGMIGLQITGTTLGEAKIVSTGFGALEVKCKKGKFDAVLEEGGKITPKYGLEECAVLKPTGCTVQGSKITSEPIQGAIEPFVSGKAPIIKLSQEANKETIAKFTIEGTSCAAAKTYKLWGEQKCLLDAAYETPEREHRIICPLANSKMKLEIEGTEMPQTAQFEVESKGALMGLFETWSVRLN